LGKLTPKKLLVNVLGVVYVRTKTSDGGDLYITRFAESSQKHLQIGNWYEKNWFEKHRIRLKGTSYVYRVPTKNIQGRSLDLVIKNCRVGEDVPLDTHTLQEFCNAEFNSPWEEFAMVTEMQEGKYGPQRMKLKTQRPLAIYVPPEKMQLWQSGRSRSKINRIRARHPGIDIDILKQYKLIYEWILGKNLIEVFETIDLQDDELVLHLKKMQGRARGDLEKKGYLMADMKPEHVIIHEADCKRIEKAEGPQKQADIVHQLLKDGKYSVIDYELVFRTPDHEDEVKHSRRHSYLDYQRGRLKPGRLPSHLSSAEIFSVPYIFGHSESTGGNLWVVGKNGRLFDYFLPERWRKTPSLSLSDTNEVLYTVTKDNIHLVWKTSRVGERPDASKYTAEEISRINKYGINSPFEAFAISHALNNIGIHSVYVRAIYMAGSTKLERSADLRKYKSHKKLLDPDGNPILQKNHNYITIRGYYNGPDEWVPEHEDVLFTPVDLSTAVRKRIINKSQCKNLLKNTIERLKEAGYDGSLLKANDLLLAVDDTGKIMQDSSGEPNVIICNFEMIWKVSDPA
jgi:hypothetical protein